MAMQTYLAVNHERHPLRVRYKWHLLIKTHVIPAKAGILKQLESVWYKIPAFAGMTQYFAGMTPLARAIGVGAS